MSIFWYKISKIKLYVYVLITKMPSLKNRKNIKKEKRDFVATPIWPEGWPKGLGVVSATPIWPLWGGRSHTFLFFLKKGGSI
jgi:hypothetical protein